LLPASIAGKHALVRGIPTAERGGAETEAADGSLVEAARAGDRAAFGRLFQSYAPMVHGVLLARVRSSDVDDLMQDVFLTAMQRIEGLRDAHAFGAWVAMIARNRAVDFHRSRRRMDELPDDLADADDGRAEAERVLAAIRELPEAYRETLVLRLVEGMTGPEIAARVGLTPESVRVNLHRGMKQLREKLGLEQKV
jgi:RNA polymerase sigma-70 factor (ECF subfamily)